MLHFNSRLLYSELRVKIILIFIKIDIGIFQTFSRYPYFFI